MIINSDQTIVAASIAGAGSTAPSNTRQTGNWMAELERAFLAEQPAPQEMSGQSDNSGNAADDAAESPAASARTPIHVQAQVPGQSQGQPQTASTAQSQMPRASSSSKALGQQDSKGTENSDNELSTSIAGKIEADSQERIGQATGHSSPIKAKELLINTAIASMAPVAHLEQATANVEGLAQQLAQYQAVAEVSATAYQVTTASSVGRVLPNISISLAISESFAGQPQLSAESEKTSFEKTPEASNENHPSPTAEPYPLRQMHMIQNDSGVSAWIRDASLSQPQALSVAQALNNELNQTGLKLNSVVLNGKKIAGLFQGNLYQNDEIRIDEKGAI